MTKIKVGEKYTLAFYDGEKFKVKVTDIKELSNGEINIHYRRSMGIFGWYTTNDDIDTFKRRLKNAELTIKHHKEI